ncbi:hypothetical protein RHGRI_029189 [Rhododendron griersonianum]|uniref:Pentatricopeptide repeat-containing protein n=1 Tax=Rhododendron griersonianum TaxID=479676 RepID=A0AAV6IKM1_9ERIC|nr:hypothetical protein RHGRI_029189 [Rhododendron griersonianum]
MEAASTGPPRLHPTPPQPPTDQQLTQKLLQFNLTPTPKTLHALRKKHLRKTLRKSNQNRPTTPPSDEEVELSHFQALKTEYRNFTRAIDASKSKPKDGAVLMVGNPWERAEVGDELREVASREEYGGEKLKAEHLRELSGFLERDRDEFRWLLDDDVEIEGGWVEDSGRRNWAPRKRGEKESIRFLVDKLSGTELSVKDWKLSRMMKKSELQFTEDQLLKIVEGLRVKGQWRNAMSVVEWVYSSKEHRHYKSRFVYTKLLSVLCNARRPREALQIFDVMRGDCQIYPDMPAYHCIAVTLGQAGFLKELMKIMECMRKKPAKRLKNMRQKNWEAILQPDVVVFNAVLNACVPSRQWKGVSWVFVQLRKNGLRPNGATYGLAMEVMLRSGKFDLVHEYFGKMRRSGEAPKALTYKGKVDEAVQVVRDMEQRGVFGTASVYYELACCLCNIGRWQEALLEVEKLKKLPHTKPLEVTFTGMIMSSLRGGHIHGCISMFQHIKDHCVIDIGIINAMLKVYGKNDMFSKAKELFEETKSMKSDSNSLNDLGSSLSADAYTYCMMLKASASAHQWEYFECVYKEMALSGYVLDQSKHVSLLIKAARAGKGHLLEHAFDSMLEAGEIPYQSVFKELICQAILQHDYERAISIVKAMAHAPFQVTVKEWTDFFERNGDRINRESLEELLETLSNNDLPMEATVSNLTKSLLFLSRSDKVGDMSRPVAFNGSSVDQSPSAGDNGKLDCGGSRNVQNFSESTEGINGKTHDIHGVGKGNLFISLEDLALDVTSDESAYDCDDELLNHTECGNLDMEEIEIDEPTSLVGDTHESNLPSADEILESWKEGRKSDGIIFSFQFGGK